MIDKTVNILGTLYTVSFRPESKDELLKGCDGYCDWTTRTIVVEKEMNGDLGNTGRYAKKVLRHEIVHAFLFESGLSEATNYDGAWARNEEMVDWIARQGPKLIEAWREADAL